MTAPERTYPRVATVTTAIPLVAQERLRAAKKNPSSLYNWTSVEFILLGMGIDPAKATVNLDTMTVTHTL